MTAPIAHIYTLQDPRTGNIRYVGETTHVRHRFSQHYAMRPDENDRKQQWFMELKIAGLQPKPRVLCMVPEPDRRLWESKWIAHYFMAGCDLVNVLTVDVWCELGVAQALLSGPYKENQERAYLLGQCRDALTRYRRDWRKPAESELAVIFG